MSNIEALYIHLPFCRRKCKYCSFISYQSRESEIPAYIKAIKKELELHSCDCKIDTIYFGGGTPSLLTPGQFKDILSTVNMYYTISENAEITIEANPGTVDAEYLSSIRAAGINRLSLGVQSFNHA